MTIPHEQFMLRALDLARQGLGKTAPNPPVGAVLVRNGTVVGQGFHSVAGKPHAEVNAIQDAGDCSFGADLYVTLEPCCHFGKTGPCTQAIIGAGINHVYVGITDPNPKVSGKGIEQLEIAGIGVTKGLCQHECHQLIAPFSKYVQTGLPFVVYKAAITLDGKTATESGDSKWISCLESRKLVHKLRSEVDGVIVGSRTVNTDDPKLTSRLVDSGRNPVRIIFDGSLSTSPHANVYSNALEEHVVLVTSCDQDESQLNTFIDSGVEVVKIGSQAGALNLRSALTELGKKNLLYLLLEGGSELASAMLKEGLIDRVMIFLAPKLLGGQGKSLFSGPGVKSINEVFNLKQLQVRQVDTDILVEGEVEYVHRPGSRPWHN